MVIDNEFDFGDIVYIKVDEEQIPYMIISIRVDPNERLLYLVSGVDDQRWFFAIELSLEINILLKTT